MAVAQCWMALCQVLLVLGPSAYWSGDILISLPLYDTDADADTDTGGMSVPPVPRGKGLGPKDCAASDLSLVGHLNVYEHQIAA